MPARVETLPRRCETAHAAKICVLNALRHQRMVQPGIPDLLDLQTQKCSTPYGIRGWCRSRPRRVSSDIGGAQRLTASEDGAGGTPLPRNKKPVTCSMPYGIRGWCSRTGGTQKPVENAVLNALRHQRMVQHADVVDNDRGMECSTPYGIRGWCSQRDIYGKSS